MLLSDKMGSSWEARPTNAFFFSFQKSLFSCLIALKSSLMEAFTFKFKFYLCLLQKMCNQTQRSSERLNVHFCFIRVGNPLQGLIEQPFKMFIIRIKWILVFLLPIYPYQLHLPSFTERYSQQWRITKAPSDKCKGEPIAQIQARMKKTMANSKCFSSVESAF